MCEVQHRCNGGHHSSRYTADILLVVICEKCNTADILLVVICEKCNTADILLVVICEKCNTADSSCGGRCSMCYLWHLPARQLVKKYTKKDELESK